MTEKDKPTVLLEYYLKKLRLPTMLREYASMAAVCQKDQSDFATYLLRLVERELLDRENRAAERRVKDASFPVLKTIDTFDFKAQPSINKQLVRELMRGEYIDKKENVLLIGNPGTGKTHLACALAFSACAQGKKAVSILPRALLPSWWNVGRKDGYSACRNSCNGFICSSWMNWGMSFL